MREISTMVIDDEEEARDGICLLLEQLPELRLVGTCENGLQAIENIHREQPELIFLDIQMPRINGFEVLKSIQPELMPKVIFVTAYDQYALKAFDYHAIDYLLKPYTDARFMAAVRHALNLMKLRDKGNSKVQELADDYIKQSGKSSEELITTDHTTRNPPDQLIVKSEGKIHFLPLEQISHITAENYYIRVHAIKNQYKVRASIKSLENFLAKTSFFRVHKSTLVNSQFISQVEPYFNGEMIIKLKSGENLKVSRHYKKNLPQIFG